MKRIRTLEEPIPSLAHYRARMGAKASWQGFRRNRSHYRELVDTLARLQHGLCGYCEIELREGDCQIEHVIPQSAPQNGAAHALVPTNMIACCRGGELESLSDDEERFRTPARENVSCGQAKGGIMDGDFIDPRTLPPLPSLTRVSYNGRIEADQDACGKAGVSADKITKTIGILRLNVERLRRAREKRWRALEHSWQERQDDHELMVAAARGELLPKYDGSLTKFFTTNRSYFAPWCEEILAEKPREWI